MTDRSNNYRRTLRQLAVASGWFERQEASDRYSLHVNVTFREERLGGEADEPIRFRVRLKQCEVVVVIEDDENCIHVDPRTIDYAKPDSPGEKSRRREKGSSASIGADGKATEKGPSFNLAGSLKRSTTKSEQISDRQDIPVINALNSRSIDGHPSWLITNAYAEHLSGSLWDPHKEPRLTIIDRRSQDTRERHKRTKVFPFCRIDLRCRREDLEILDITLKDKERDGIEKLRQDYEVRLRAAESFIKHQLQLEGLAVGDIHDLFSELVIGDLIIPVFDES